MNWERLIEFMILLAPEGAGAGTGEGDGTPGAGEGAPGADAGNGVAGAPYLPEGLPDHLRGENDHGTIDKLWTAFSGARDRLAKQGTVPDNADGYTWDALSQATRDLMPDMDSDPVLPIARQAAHACGISNEQLNSFVDYLMPKCVETGAIEGPLDKAAELKLLESDEIADGTERAAKAEARQSDALAFVKGLQQRSILTEESAALLSSMGVYAEGVKTIEQLQAAMRGSGVQLGAGAGAGRGRAEVEADMDDPRYDSESPKFDPAFRKRVDEEWKALFQ